MVFADILFALIIIFKIIAKKNNINKREYRGLLKILKKYKYLLIRARFVVKFNIKNLII